MQNTQVKRATYAAFASGRQFFDPQGRGAPALHSRLVPRARREFLAQPLVIARMFQLLFPISPRISNIEVNFPRGIDDFGWRSPDLVLRGFP
jgi:hypothetical protein